MTPNDRAKAAAEQIARNTDAASEAMNGPRFLFQEYIDEVAAIITGVIADSEAALAQAVRERDLTLAEGERLREEGHRNYARWESALASKESAIDSLTAERDSLTRQLAEAKEVAKVQESRITIILEQSEALRSRILASEQERNIAAGIPPEGALTPTSFLIQQLAEAKAENERLADQRDKLLKSGTLTLRTESQQIDDISAQLATATDALTGMRSVLQFELSQNEKHGQKTTQFELEMFCVQQADRLRKALSAPASQDGETKAANKPICGSCGEYVQDCTCVNAELRKMQARIAEVEESRRILVENRDKAIIALTTQHDAALARIAELEGELTTANHYLAQKECIACGGLVDGREMARVKELEEDGKLLDELECIGRKNSETDRDHDWYVRFSKYHTDLRSAIRSSRPPAIRTAMIHQKGVDQ